MAEPVRSKPNAPFGPAPWGAPFGVPFLGRRRFIEGLVGGGVLLGASPLIRPA